MALKQHPRPSHANKELMEGRAVVKGVFVAS